MFLMIQIDDIYKNKDNNYNYARFRLIDYDINY